MEITGFLMALIVGLIIGALGRLALPGRQNVPLWLTMVVGVVAALLGSFVASLLGVRDTNGIDWIQLALQIAFAAGGIALVGGFYGRRGGAITH